jgi:alkylhydroperoxidase/carboxymuconolactone decarboxylase family protein YurZ
MEKKHRKYSGSGDKQKTEADEKILAAQSQGTGHVSPALQLMALRPGTVDAFASYRAQILTGGPLTEKEQSLIMLASAICLKSAQCIRANADRARKSAATEDEITQTILIAGLASGSSPLRLAYEALTGPSAI